jgi:hypothetical protein
MKNLQKAFLALLFSCSIAFYSCGPNDDKGSMDQDNSKGEGAVDSTRLSNFDSTSAGTGDSARIK